MTVLLGIDLSATACAVVACPLDWDGNWARVASMVVGEKLHRDSTDTERARRCETIASRVVRFARDTGASAAYFESYAFSQKTAAHTLAEVGGCVRLELVRAGVDIRTAQISTARKLLLGSCPKGAKVLVAAAFKAAGARFETLDESDAMTCANFALSELGGYCFCQVGESTKDVFPALGGHGQIPAVHRPIFAVVGPSIAKGARL